MLDISKCDRYGKKYIYIYPGRYCNRFSSNNESQEVSVTDME